MEITKVRVPAIALSLLLIAGFVFASGEQEGASSNNDEVTITVWKHNPQNEPFLLATTEAFMEQHPNINVEYEIKTPDQYYNVLLTAMQSGAAPDVFWTHGTKTPQMPAMVESGDLMDLTDHIDTSMYPQAHIDVSSVDGRLYSTPVAYVGTRVVYYNKDIFEEQGLEVPETFADFENILKTLYENDIQPLSLGGQFFWSGMFHFEPILAAMGYDWLQQAENYEVDFLHEDLIAAMEKMNEWGEAGYYGRNFMGVDEGGQLLAFSTGRAAMTITGTHNTATIQANNPDLQVGAFYIPTEDGIVPIMADPGSGYSVYQGTDHPEAAIEFAQWLASAESAQIYVDEQEVIPVVDGIEAPSPIVEEMTRFDEPVISWWTVMGHYPYKEDHNPRAIFQEDFQKVMSGDLSPEELLRSMHEGYDYAQVGLSVD
jgi:raffinose/stachyose/melibiose transport system substrate-binding protein